MELITATNLRLAINGWIDMNITVLMDGVETVLPYTYDPAETNPINLEVAGWIMSNPDEPIGPYVPPPPAAPDFLTVLREGMLEEFVNRMANNATAPKRLKDAALALKAMK